MIITDDCLKYRYNLLTRRASSEKKRDAVEGMKVVSYLILLAVLLVVVSVLGILAVTFRSCLRFWCCKNLSDSEDGSTAGSVAGHRNVAFDDQEEVPTVRPRPFNSMEPTECPPSYEEAIRQELFRFQLPGTSIQSSAGECSSQPVNDHHTPPPFTSPSTSSPTSSSPQSSPSTNPKHRQSRPTSGSGGTPPLYTINEEEEWPVQVVIDCIGVQTARLLDNCNTTVHLTNGSELTTNSKC